MSEDVTPSASTMSFPCCERLPFQLRRHRTSLGLKCPCLKSFLNSPQWHAMYKTECCNKEITEGLDRTFAGSKMWNCTLCSLSPVCCASSRHLGAEAIHEGTAKAQLPPPAISHYASIHYEQYLNYWPWPITMGIQSTDALPRFWPPVVISCSLGRHRKRCVCVDKCIMLFGVKDVQLSLNYCREGRKTNIPVIYTFSTAVGWG